jgi:S1-C subfamily serine protease
MQQAPTSVTVPINRIVRQTVEKIVPGEGKNTVQTVVIKEEDLVVDAIAKNESATFSITKEILDIDGKTIETGAGNGFIVSSDGIVVADSSLVFDASVYYLKNESGKFHAEFISIGKNGFSFLKIGAPLDEKNKIAFTVPAFGDLSKIKIGQKILVLGNTIASFIFDGNKDIKTNIAKSNAGALILDLDGEALGIALSGDTFSFASIDSILEVLKAKEAKTETKNP